jgi:hypothetical protein
MNQPGIINPFVEPEPARDDPKGFDKNPEPEQPPENMNAKLDGDSFGLSFDHVDEDTDLSDRLAKLLYDVNERFSGELRECGIKVLRPTIAYIPEPGEMVLRAKSAVIVVATGATLNEAAAFRRISHALQMLPIKEILKKHNAMLHVRG